MAFFSPYGGRMAEVIFEKGLYLPSGSNLTTSYKKRIKKAIFESSKA